VRPENAFLNAEYYIRPGSKRTMIPRALSAGRKTEHELAGGSVRVRFPREPEFSLELMLTYSVCEDAVDLGVEIVPGMDVPGFELFFASYVCEALEETWVPLANEDGSRDWKRLANRGHVGRIFGVMRDASMRNMIPEAYPELPVDVEERPYSEPILVAGTRNPDSRWSSSVILIGPGISRASTTGGTRRTTGPTGPN
jgi:hypothetical protein